MGVALSSGAWLMLAGGLVAADAGPITPEPTGTLLGWRLTGTWERQDQHLILAGALEGPGTAAELTVRLPRPVEDLTVRVRMPADARRVPLRIVLPLAAVANPHNLYRLSFRAEGSDVSAERILTLAGRQADAALLGAPRSTRDLPPSRFGTCLHLAYGWKPGTSFPGWKDHERLLDEVAACGLGWVRDEVAFEPGGDGAWRIHASDATWLTAAKARGLRTLVILPMAANDAPEVLADRGRALATAPGLVDAIMLGHEPALFGGWRERHGGAWHARDPDGSTAPWLKRHLTVANAVAEAIKRVRADVPVVGGYALPPINARAMALGLSPAIDGVADHPYGYSLPPEVIAYGAGFADRDGLAVGDESHTMAGLLDWYRGRLAALDRPRPLWITAFGWTTFHHGLDNTGTLHLGVTEETQAAWLVRRHLLHRWHDAMVSLQFALLDDQARPEAEGRFGLLRADGSRKPAWHATRRLCSLFAGATPDRSVRIAVPAAPLHAGQQRTANITWDGVILRLPQDIIALPFRHETQAAVRTLAVWSALPADGFNGRTATVRIDGWSGYGWPVAVGLCSGRLTDVPWTRQGDVLELTVSLEDEPLAIRLFR